MPSPLPWTWPGREVWRACVHMWVKRKTWHLAQVSALPRALLWSWRLRTLTSQRCSYWLLLGQFPRAITRQLSEGNNIQFCFLDQLCCLGEHRLPPCINVVLESALWVNPWLIEVGCGTWDGEEWAMDSDWGEVAEAAAELQEPISLGCSLKKEQGKDRTSKWTDYLDEIFSSGRYTFKEPKSSN